MADCARWISLGICRLGYAVETVSKKEKLDQESKDQQHRIQQFANISNTFVEQ